MSIARIQSIYFRARYGYSASEIARIVGLKPQTVRNMHSFYLKERPLFKYRAGVGGVKVISRLERKKPFSGL